MSTASLNKCAFIGRLGNDPEKRYLASGAPVTSFSIATEKKYKDKNGAYQTKTEWHNIVAWNNLAETTHKYLKKGKLVYIEAEHTTQTWDGRDGKRRYKSEFVAYTCLFLPSGSGYRGDNKPGEEPGAAAQDQEPIKYGDVPDEDIPF